jgi:hypothetical protein
VLIRTAQFSSKQINVEPVTDIDVDGKEVAKHLASALRFKTNHIRIQQNWMARSFLLSINISKRLFQKFTMY